MHTKKNSEFGFVVDLFSLSLCLLYFILFLFFNFLIEVYGIAHVVVFVSCAAFILNGKGNCSTAYLLAFSLLVQ